MQGKMRSRNTRTNDSVSPNHSRRARSPWHGEFVFANIGFCTAIIQVYVEEEVRTEPILRKTNPQNFTITLLIFQKDEKQPAIRALRRGACDLTASWGCHELSQVTRGATTSISASGSDV